MNEMESCGGSESDCSISTTYSEYAKDPPNKHYKCTFEKCDKSFYRPSKLKNHMRIHTGEKPFKCEIPNCDKSYHRKDLLKKHHEEVHNKKIKYIVCPEEGCGQKMRQNSYRKHILRKHNSYRRWNFQCDECDKGFRNENELRNHMNEHFPIFQCETCGKEFKKGSLFRRHVTSHKEYECLCEQKFYDHNIFRTHKKNCELTRPSCGICGKKFVNHGNLKEHIAIVHVSNQDKIKCTVEGCAKEYNRKSSLKHHIEKSHKVKDGQEAKLMCSICSKLLKNEVYLWRHMKNIHINEDKRKIKKPRKPRHDKNVPKVPILTLLTGIEHKESDIKKIKIEEKPNSDSEDEVLVKKLNTGSKNVVEELITLFKNIEEQPDTEQENIVEELKTERENIVEEPETEHENITKELDTECEEFAKAPDTEHENVVREPEIDIMKQEPMILFMEVKL